MPVNPLTQINTLRGRVRALEVKVAALERLLAPMSMKVIQGYPSIVFSNVNVHVRSGAGKTDAPVNGLGNLIVGYNEKTAIAINKSGSHNVVIGRHHSYSSYGGLVAGYRNAITGKCASVSGGRQNKASGNYASVSGGSIIEASGNYASVSGGYSNKASGNYASVSGGGQNKASGIYASVSGGRLIEASGNFASVSGGYGNKASGNHASVSGGRQNKASGNYASVSGGKGRTANASDSWCGGTLSG